MTLYLGAGGGGDTNAAVMCALADTSPGKKLVIGAGYSLDEYTKAFIKEQKNRKTGEIDRKAMENATYITNYLNESLKNYKEETDSNSKTDVWRLNDNEKTAMELLFNAVKPEEGVDYYDPELQKRHSSYKYQGLLEERLLLRKLKETLGDNDVFNNIYILFTTSNWTDTSAINKSYNALKDFITTKMLQKIVLMDFGGDLIEFTKAGRDPIVLLNCLRLLKDPQFQNLTIEIWIYGPGVDSHALPDKILSNITKFREVTTNTGEFEKVDIKPLIKFIEDHATLLNEIDILGLNRATGNWYEAYKNCLESMIPKGGARKKTIKRGGGIDKDTYIDKGLKSRTEYSGLKNQDDKQVLDIGWEQFFTSENAWCKLAETYKFTLTACN